MPQKKKEIKNEKKTGAAYWKEQAEYWRKKYLKAAEKRDYWKGQFEILTETKVFKEALNKRK